MLKLILFCVTFLLCSISYAKPENSEVTCSLSSDGKYDPNKFNFSSKGPIYASSKSAERIKIGLNKDLIGKIHESHLAHRFDIGYNFHLEIIREKASGRLFYFLGENHVKKDKETKLGKKIVDMFRVRMIEGAPEIEMEKCLSTPVKAFISAYSNVGTITNFIFGINGSTVNDAYKDAKLIGCSDLNSISTRKNENLVIQMECGKTFEPESPVCIFSAKDEDSKKCDDWTLKFRNERMIENIKKVSLKLPPNEPVLIIAGSTHVTGTLSEPESKSYLGIPAILAKSDKYQTISECWVD